MNVKLLKLLATIAAALCFIIVCEWMYAVYAQKRLLDEVSATSKLAKTSTQLPSVNLADRPETSYVDLVNRPLFIQGRRPVSEAENDKTTVAPVANGKFNWELSGVYKYHDSLHALFSRTSAKVPKDNYRKVTKDNDIDGWKLIDIQQDKVIVSLGSEQKELPLRKAKPKVAANNGMNPLMPPPVPNPTGQPPQPGQQPIPEPPVPELIPGQMPEPIPEQMPEPIPEQLPEPIIEPEQIPDQSSETYFENNANEQFQ